MPVTTAKTNTVAINATGIVGSITFLTIKYMPPINRAIALVSPKEPPIKPRNISKLDGTASEPVAITPKGVGPVTASTIPISFLGKGQVVMGVAKDINSTILAVIAGLTKFCPIPPNSCFTITIATKQPITAIQKGKLAGRLNASNTPVTTAL